MKVRTKNLLIHLLVIIFIFSAIELKSQDTRRSKNAPPLSERVFYGGTFSMQFGDYTYVDVSPNVGIWLLPRLAIAAGPSYKYFADQSGSTDAYGAKGFLRLVLIQDLNSILPLGIRMSIFTHGEYEAMSYRSDYFYTSYENDRFMQDFLLLGVGVSQYFGLRSSINVSVLWVVNESEIQIYDSPEVRVGFTF